MKELKDYIHLYIGCDVLITDEELVKDLIEAGGNGRGILTGLHGEYGPEFAACQGHHTSESPEYTWDMKLILRPLYGMTEDEAIEIAKIIWGQPDSVKWRAERRKDYWSVKRKHHSRSITIDTDMGEVTYYEGDELADTHKHHFVTLWMLKKGFDLFDLHAAGLCVYENEIPK